MTIETHFESAKQCQNLFGLNEATTLGKLDLEDGAF